MKFSINWSRGKSYIGITWMNCFPFWNHKYLWSKTRAICRLICYWKHTFKIKFTLLKNRLYTYERIFAQLIFKLRIRLVLPGKRLEVHILVRLLFTKIRVLIYQYLISNYFEIQVLNAKKFSKISIFHLLSLFKP